MDSGISDEKEGPTVLENMIQKHASIEQMVSLIKKELLINSMTNEKGELLQEPVKLELEGLGNLLTDSKIKAIIKSMAGQDTHNLIDELLVIINSSLSIEDKHKALAGGIKKIRSNLAKISKLTTKDDSRLHLAMDLVGLSQERMN